MRKDHAAALDLDRCTAPIEVDRDYELLAGEYEHVFIGYGDDSIAF